MLFRQSLLLALVSLAAASDEGSARLGSSLSNFESVGTGRHFKSEPLPEIDRERLLAENPDFDSEVMAEDVHEETVGEGKVFEKRPIQRRLRRTGGAKKEEPVAVVSSSW